MKPYYTYSGQSVRIAKHSSPDGRSGHLTVQQANPLTNGWDDVATYHESASYCYTDAKNHAAGIAANLWRDKAHQLLPIAS